MMDELRQWVEHLVKLAVSYSLFCVAVYHGVRAVAAFVVGNTTGAKEHGLVCVAFIVGGLAVQQT